MAEKIRYDIDVNARDGVRELDRLGKAGREAGKDLEDSFDDAASAADQAAAAILAMAQKSDTELRAAAEAADALATALGPELTGKMDVDQVVVDLNRMGVTFDEIRADADKFAATLKQVDDIRVSQATDGLDGMGRKLQDANEQATNARGALANMIGNSAQDISGLSSSLGVAIGQMAEYSADALLAGANTKQAFKEMALIAAPVAGLAAITMGIDAVKGSVDAWNKSQAEFLQQQIDFNEAVRNTGSQFQAVSDLIADNVLLQPAPEMNAVQSMINDLPILGRMLDDTAEATDTVATSLAAAGISQQEWFDAMRVDIPGGLARYNALNDKLQQLKDSGQITGDQFNLLSEQFARQGSVVATNAVQTANAIDVTAASLDDMNNAMSEHGRQTGLVDAAWNTLTEAMRDGHTESAAAEQAWHTLQNELHLSNEEIAAMVAQNVAGQLDEDAAAAEEAASKIAEMGDTIREAQQAAQDYDRIVSGTDWGAATAQAAETAVQGYFDEFARAGNEAADQAEAYDNLGAAIDTANEAGLSWFETLFSVDSPEGRAVRQALGELGTTLIPDIEQAYTDADGDQEQFRRNMAILGERTLVRLQNELGISRDEANALAQQLGLVPENVDTIYRLIGDEEAKIKLGLLQSAIEALPKNVQTQVTQQILLGDYQGALATVQNYYNTHGATVPVDADFSEAYDALARFAQAVRGAQILAHVAATFPSASASAQSAAVSAAPMSAPTSRGLAAVSPVVVQSAPAQVTIQAAVIGNRFEVQRAVTRALRQSQRLNGVRVA